MITKNDNSFWTGTPNTKHWKKTIAIIGSILFIIIASFGVASAKYGYKNISSLVLHGHFETVTKNKIQNIPSDYTISQDVTNTDSSLNSDSNLNNSSSSSDFLSSSKNPLLNTDKNDSTKYYTNSNGIKVESPDSNPVGATARCKDGTYSHSLDSQGSCSDHGGVASGSSITAAVPCDQWIVDNYERQKQSIRDAYSSERSSNEQSKSQEINTATRIGEQNIAAAKAAASAAGQPDNAPQVQQAEQDLQRSIETINQKYQSHYNSRDSQMALDINAVDLKESEYTLICK